MYWREREERKEGRLTGLALGKKNIENKNCNDTVDKEAKEDIKQSVNKTSRDIKQRKTTKIVKAEELKPANLQT